MNRSAMSMASAIATAALSGLLVLVPVGAYADTAIAPTPSPTVTAPATDVAPANPEGTPTSSPGPSDTSAPVPTTAPSPSTKPAPDAAVTRSAPVGPLPALQAAAVTNPTFASLAAAFANAASGATITLSQDLTGGPSDPPLRVPDNREVTLDLNGHTLTVTRTDDHAAVGVPANSTLTITDSSDPTVAVGHLIVNSGEGAGIGADYVEGQPGTGGAFGNIVISGASVDAYAVRGAGIGSTEAGRPGGSITIMNNPGHVSVVTARSDINAGIGGASSSTWQGSVTILGGQVTAQGGDNGGGAAGIGGGNDFSTMGKITISNNAHVTATGGGTGAGIGGGDHSQGTLPPITIDTGSWVNAVGGSGGAGISAGEPVDGGSVPVNVTVSSATLVLSGPSGMDLSDPRSSLGTGNDSELIINEGTTLTIPAHMAVVNNGGDIQVFGKVVNHGVIQNMNGATVRTAENVSDNNTTIKWDAVGGTTPVAQTGPVFARSMDIAGLDLIPRPTRTGYTFQGWYTEPDGGTQLTEFSDLGGGGPKTITAYATWTPQVEAGGPSSGGPGTAPTVTPGSPQSTAPTSHGASVTTLADTGSDITPLAIIGATVLAIGAAITAAAAIRRRIKHNTP